ncbi:MAG TPA: MtrB/PioB family decaheme-associated outer membrane protein [Psychromonas sp.]
MTDNFSSVSLCISAALAVMVASSPGWALDMTFSPKRASKEVNQQSWICKRCKSKVVSAGQLEMGAAIVSNNAYAFRNLEPSRNGEGVAIVSGDGKWVNASGSSSKAAAKDLGLERFKLSAGYQSAGNGGAEISYRELPRYYSNQALSPYAAVAENARLPANWQSAGSTEGITDLNNNGHPEEIKLLRKSLLMNSDFRSSNSLRPELGLRLEKQTGQKVSSGYLAGGATNWITPVDQYTLIIDAGLTKTTDHGLLSVAYLGSLYENQKDSLNWQNPYSSYFPGTEYGQLGNSPDNQAQQLSLNGRYQWLSSQISGRLAYGLQTQDQDFNPYTVNSSLLTSDLPAQSADAKVKTINADINASHRINHQWRLTAKIKVQDRDNQTPSYLFTTPVVADTYVAGSASNQAYSYRREQASVTGHYRGLRAFPVKFGYQYEGFYRSLGDREQTHDNQIWVSAKSKAWQPIVAGAKLIAGRRGGSEFNLDAAEVLRRYNLADRDLLEARVSADWQLTDALSSLIKARYSVDDYDNTEVGLTERNRLFLDWDWNWQASKLSSFYTGIGYQRFRYQQTGTNSSGYPSWSGSLDDRTYTLMLGGESRQFFFKSLTVGMDYVLSYGKNQQSVDLSINNGTGYPENYYRNHLLKAWTDYQITRADKIKFNVIYQHVDDRDYYWSDTQPDSLPSVLTVGDLSQGYSSWYAGISYNHRF